jgi:hypothetical protein
MPIATTIERAIAKTITIIITGFRIVLQKL